jgi:hypothetical protein
MVSKNAEFHADFKSVKKVLKRHTQKLASKTNLRNMRKNGKSAYFSHIFMGNFVKKIFTDFKSA